ncbi:hypothetical protein SAMN05443245_1379 [Paraburkholderia fungorum]|uniref:Uncharacterized protein n=1 Tax=Paraburkholderia fungorum TaxID=134537 RepID=A0A1H1AVX0_9BURK|nr:hypothetical protein SAMN05443245_1379 [Paraburkholderia fungorum]
MSIRLRVKCRPWSGMPFAHFSIGLRMLGCGSVALNMRYVKRSFSFVLDQAHHKSQKFPPRAQSASTITPNHTRQ